MGAACGCSPHPQQAPRGSKELPTAIRAARTLPVGLARWLWPVDALEAGTGRGPLRKWPGLGSRGEGGHVGLRILPQKQAIGCSEAEGETASSGTRAGQPNVGVGVTVSLQTHRSLPEHGQGGRTPPPSTSGVNPLLCLMSPSGCKQGWRHRAGKWRGRCHVAPFPLQTPSPVGLTHGKQTPPQSKWGSEHTARKATF